MTVFENVFYYFKMEICQNRERGILILFQTAYSKAVLEQFEMSDCNPINTPIDSGFPNIFILSSLNYQACLETIF